MNLTIRRASSVLSLYNSKAAWLNSSWYTSPMCSESCKEKKNRLDILFNEILFITSKKPFLNSELTIFFQDFYFKWLQIDFFTVLFPFFSTLISIENFHHVEKIFVKKLVDSGLVFDMWWKCSESCKEEYIRALGIFEFIIRYF